MELSAQRLFSENAVVRLTFNMWGNKKDQSDDAEKRVGTWFRYVDPKDLQPIQAVVRKARSYLGCDVGAHFDWGPGLYLVRRAKLIQILEKLRAFKFEFVDAVEAFVFERYEVALAETKAKGILTQDQLDTAPVADELLSKYKMTYTTFVVGLPESVGDAEVDRIVAEEFCGALDESFSNVGDRLREELADLMQVVHAAATDPDRRKFFESMLSNVADWCDSFETRNFLADDDLAAVASNARAMVETFDINDIRENTGIRAALSAQSDALLRRLREMRPARRRIIL